MFAILDPSHLMLSWLEATVLLPLVGSLIVSLLTGSARQRLVALLFSGATLLVSVGMSLDFLLRDSGEGTDGLTFFANLLDDDLLVIDRLNAPLIPLAALLCFLVQLTTSQTKIRRFPFDLALLSESILLGTLVAREALLLVGLLILGTLPVYWELKRRGRPTFQFVAHMGLFSGLLVAGAALQLFEGIPSEVSVILITLAVLLRNGVFPLHGWLRDLFEQASFGTALMFVTPMVGVYAAMRLVLPIAPDWILQSIAMLSLLTALYASGMTLVQKTTRRFFTYLFLSFSSLILVGLETATLTGLTGALCVWISVSLSLTGFGLTLRAVEARTGRLSLEEYHGLYEKTPLLAGFFLLTGMASIGFPGTINFIGTELLLDGTSKISFWIETLVVLATAINSIAVLHAYFRVFTGKTQQTSLDLTCKMRERIAVLLLSCLILGGGMYPQPGVASRYEAAKSLLSTREENLKDYFPQYERDDDDDEDGHDDDEEDHDDDAAQRAEKKRQADDDDEDESGDGGDDDDGDDDQEDDKKDKEDGDKED